MLLLQENLSDFQAKYQKLLVRASGILEEEPSWRGPLLGWPGTPGGSTERSFGLSCSCAPLQAGSQQRQQDLNSLQDYMQRCTNKLYWLDQQAKDRTHYDWSDHNLDYPSRRRQYEVCVLPAAWPCSASLVLLRLLPGNRELAMAPGELDGGRNAPSPASVSPSPT